MHFHRRVPEVIEIKVEETEPEHSAQEALRSYAGYCGDGKVVVGFYRQPTVGCFDVVLHAVGCGDLFFQFAGFIEHQVFVQVNLPAMNVVQFLASEIGFCLCYELLANS